jgi:hypothetical protein
VDKAEQQEIDRVVEGGVSAQGEEEASERKWADDGGRSTIIFWRPATEDWRL